MQKTLKIKLNLANAKKLAILNAAEAQLREVARLYLAFKKQQLETKDYSVAFKTKYAEYRKIFSHLNSAILQNFMRYIDDQVKLYISTCKKKHKLVKFPEIKNIVIPLRNDCFHAQDSTHTKFDKWLLFLRHEFPFNVEDNPQASGVLAQTTSFADSSLILKGGTWTLFLVCNLKDPVPSASSGVLGVDIGIVHPIVCSDGKFIGNGRKNVHKKIEFAKYRASHQKNEKLKKVSHDKQARWTRDTNHKLSKELIDHCLSEGKGVLALEDLNGSKLANRKYRKFVWACGDLGTKIRYKAELAGIKVISVDPRYTSQTCRVCGHQETSNRLSRSVFSCVACGHTENADVNAAKNIRDKAIAHIANGVNVNPPTGKALNLEKTQL